MLGRACAGAWRLSLEATSAVLGLCTAGGRTGRVSRIALAAIVAVSAYGWFAQFGLAGRTGRSADAATIALVPAHRSEGAVILVANAAPTPVASVAPTSESEVIMDATPDTREASVEAASVPTAAPTAKIVAPPEAPKPAAAAATSAPATSPAATSVPAATPSARVYTAAEVKSLASQAGWPDALVDDVVAVATCESGLYSGAQGGGALGLMQVMPWWFDQAGIDIGKWSDPVSNLTVARYVYGASGWSAWSCTPPPARPTGTPDPSPATPTAASR